MIELLKKYCNILGPSGMEDEIREAIISDIKDCGFYTTDKCGNLIVFKKGLKPRDKKVVFSAHMDEVGFMVTHISKDGYLYFATIGGIDPRVIAGKRVIFAESNIPGVIASTAIHMQKPEERGFAEKICDLYIDIGCKSCEEASKIISVGDCAVFEPNFEVFGDNMIKSKAIDDRFGCVVLVSMLQAELEFDTWFVFCTAEEVGTRGAMIAAYSIKPDIAFIIESTTAGDVPGAPKNMISCQVGMGAVISFMDHSTIYPADLVNHIMKCCADNNIPHQLKNYVAGGNDAGAYQRIGGGCKVAAISAPTRYIHSSCNVASLSDLESVLQTATAINKREF